MAGKIQNICVIVFLCTVILFITGIALPRYISDQSSKQQKSLRPSASSMKLVSHDDILYSNTETNIMKNENSFASRDKQTDKNSRDIAGDINADPLQEFEKVKKRIKRKSSEVSSELFSWNFNISVSRLENVTNSDATKSDSETSSGNKHAGVVVYVESQGSRQKVFEEMQLTLGSVGAFIKNLFSGGLGSGTSDHKDENESENLQSFNKNLGFVTTRNLNHMSSTENKTKLNDMQKIQTAQSFNESLQTSDLESKDDINAMNFDDDGSRNETLDVNGRKGRIWFNLFGFGENSVSTNVPVSEAEAAKNITDGIETDENALRSFTEAKNITDGIETNENALRSFTEAKNITDGIETDENALWSFTEAKKGTDVTEAGENALKSLKDETPLNLKVNTESSLIEPNFNFNSFTTENQHQAANFNEEILEKFALPTSEKDECSGCVTENFKLSVSPDKVSKNMKQEIHQAEFSTNEMLERFCIGLFNKLEPQTPDKRARSFNSEISENLLNSAQNPVSHNFNLSSTLEEIAKTDITIIDSPIKSDQTTMVLTDTDGFFKMLDSGSGGSEITGDKRDMVDGQDKFTTLPSILDCEKYFGEKRGLVFPKSDHVDINIFRKLSQDFGNSTLPKEQQLVILLGLNNSVQTLDTISGEESVFGSESDSFSNEDFAEKDPLMNINEEIGTNLNDFNLNEIAGISKSNDLGDGFELTTSEQKHGRIFSFLGFGSGSEDEGRQKSEGRFITDLLGSGARSLETPEDQADSVSDLESGDSFKGDANFSGDGRILITSESMFNGSIVTSSESSLFLDSLNSAGSGDGRALSMKIPTESDDIFDNECGDDCSPDIGDESPMCDDHGCDFENPPNLEIANKEDFENCSCHHKTDFTDENGTFSECDKCSLNSMKIMNESNQPDSNFESHIVAKTFPTSENPMKLDNERESGCQECVDDHNFNEKRVTEIIIAIETLKSNDLTDANATMIEFKSQDIIPFNPNVINITDHQEATIGMFESQSPSIESPKQNETNTHRFMGTIFLTGSGDGGLFGEDDGGPINLVEEESTVGSAVHPRRKGRLDDSFFGGRSPDMLEERNLEVLNNSNNHSNNILTKPENMASERKPKTLEVTENSMGKENMTFISLFSNRPSQFPTVLRTEPQPRSCIAAKDCDSVLNERCIKINSSSVCDCGRTFVRQRETGKCVGKRFIDATLKFPAEVFDANLKNPESPIYKQRVARSIETMWLLLSETPGVLPIVTDVNVHSFTPGSLIVNLNIVVAVGNESDARIVKRIESELQKTLKKENLVERAALNIVNASVLSISSELDPCKSTELNYCSKNAECIWSEAYPERYTCHCREHYLDVTSDSFYPGETCIAKCPPSYCGPNGHCETSESGERHCLCNGLYFGERCEFPGFVILCSLSVAALIFIAILCAVIISVRCKNRSYGRTPTFRRSEAVDRHTIAAGRVSDVVYLENRDSNSKFSQISTPMKELPVIKVIRPSLNESSITSEFESTFNTSNSANTQKSENVPETA